MAVSNTSIANRALQLLGARRIDDIDDTGSVNAREMKAAFDHVRDALLRKHRWKFAGKRAALAADSTGTVHEGLNRFQVPADFIALRRQQVTASVDDHHDWELEGRYIVTADGAPLNIRYTARVTDPAEFDPLFSELLAAELALATVNIITGSNVKRQLLERTRDSVLADARRANAFESAPLQLPEDDWIKEMR